MSPGADAAVVMRIIRQRRSVRTGYSGGRISRDVLGEIINAGVHAPSGSNAQSVRFLVLVDETRMRSIIGPRGMDPEGRLGSPCALVLVFASRLPGKWRQLAVQDAATAIQNILIAATAFDVASWWVSAYDWMSGRGQLSGHAWSDLLASYEIAPALEIMGLIVLGWADMAGDEMHRGRPVKRGPVGDYVLNVEGGWRP